MMKKTRSIWALFVVCLSAACSHISIRPKEIYSGTSLKQETLTQLLERVGPGSVVLIGESHTNPNHHKNQEQVIERLAQVPNQPVRVAFEHLSYTQQSQLDGFQDGLLDKNVFLTATEFDAGFFNYYSDLFALTKKYPNVRFLAVNCPRALTRKVSAQGLATLSMDEQKLLPPNPTLGRPEYLERVEEVLQAHHDTKESKLAGSDKMQNYLWAQSLWDDTMAWQIAKQLQREPHGIVVVIVGNFHLDYGGGLPDRLRARGVGNILTISQVQVNELRVDQRRKALYPNPKLGPRADYIWTTE